MIPYGRQEITQSDIDEVVSVLKSDFITQGPQVPAFERMIAEKVGAKYAVASSSATSALHLACRALNVQVGDVVWTSPITFVASANCALYCGAEVDFVDIDRSTCNMCVSTLELKLEKAKKIGRLPKVVIPVHFGGQSCDMARIKQLSEVYGFSVIEDASHAIGAQYKGASVGCCLYSDITIFSFHPVKIITTGEGGMALTNETYLADTMRILSSHGITRNPEEMDCEPDGPWYYQQVALGFNYRMTDIQAALGISQAKRLSDYVRRRNELADIYDQSFRSLPVTPVGRSSDSYSAFHLYVIRIGRDLGQDARKLIYDYLQKENIRVNVHYIPVHLQPWYRQFGFTKTMFPEAERYYEEAISLPMFPTLSDDEQQRVIQAVAGAVDKVQRGKR